MASAGPDSRIVTFAPMLKHDTFPLAEILDVLICAGEDALGNPVEIEFAVRLPQVGDQSAEFAFLQIRPLTPLPQHRGFISGRGATRAVDLPEQQGSGQRTHRRSSRCSGRRFAAF